MSWADEEEEGGGVEGGGLGRRRREPLSSIGNNLHGLSHPRFDRFGGDDNDETIGSGGGGGGGGGNGDDNPKSVSYNGAVASREVDGEEVIIVEDQKIVVEEASAAAVAPRFGLDDEKETKKSKKKKQKKKKKKQKGEKGQRQQQQQQQQQPSQTQQRPSAKKLAKILRSACCSATNPNGGNALRVAAAACALTDATSGLQPSGKVLGTLLSTLVGWGEVSLAANLLDRQRRALGLPPAVVPTAADGRIVHDFGDEDEADAGDGAGDSKVASAAAAAAAGDDDVEKGTPVRLAAIRLASHPQYDYETVHADDGRDMEAKSIRPLVPDHLVSALSSLPQTKGIHPEEGAALVDAAAALLRLVPSGGSSSSGAAAAAESGLDTSVSTAGCTSTPLAVVAPQEARTYLHRRLRWAALQLLDEGSAALAGSYSAPPEALARTGRCVYDARCKPGGREGQVLVEDGRNGGEDVRRSLQPGDVVAVRRCCSGRYAAAGKEQQHGRIIEAEVKLASPLVLEPMGPDRKEAAKFLLTDDDAATGRGGQSMSPLRWRVDKLANRVQADRAMHGLRIVASAAAAAGADSARRSADGAGGKGGQGRVQGGGKERRMRWPAAEIATAIVAADCDAEGVVVVSGASSSPCRAPLLAAASLAAAPLGTNLAEAARIGRLNSSQAEALRTAATQRMTLIQGPPGTGKTAVSVQLLSEWAKNGAPDLGGRGTTGGGSGDYGPASSSNKSGGGRGTSKTVGPSVLAVSDSNVAVDNLLDGLLKKGVRAVRTGRPDPTRPQLLPHSVDSLAQDAAEQARRTGRDPREASFQARQRALSLASVVCATCIGAGSAFLDKCHFSYVLVDEAAQATELATVVAISRGAEQLVLVGDHHQLPPTVPSETAASDGLGSSLFERLVDASVPTSLLTTQYRMHPAISAFPSACFYDGHISDGVISSDRPPIPGFDWPRDDFPVAFVPTNKYSMESGDGKSKCNQTEATIVSNILQAVLSGGSHRWGGPHPLAPSDIGVVTPYAAQVRLIRQSRPHPAIEVQSVDGFQGREKELIVISTVRANSSGNVGFTADWRRANVALTRARRGVIIVGHYETMIQEPRSWGPLLTFFEANGCVLGQRPPREYPPLQHSRELASRICCNDNDDTSDTEASSDGRKRSPDMDSELLEARPLKRHRVELN